MTAEVVFEVQGDSGRWVRAGSVAEVEPPGSFSSHEPIGRQVYVFGWLDGQPGVWRSHGADIENSAVREIHSTRFDRLADLAVPFELDWWRTKMARPHRVRFTLTGGSEP